MSAPASYAATRMRSANDPGASNNGATATTVDSARAEAISDDRSELASVAVTSQPVPSASIRAVASVLRNDALSFDPADTTTTAASAGVSASISRSRKAAATNGSGPSGGAVVTFGDDDTSAGTSLSLCLPG